MKRLEEIRGRDINLIFMVSLREDKGFKLGIIYCFLNFMLKMDFFFNDDFWLFCVSLNATSCRSMGA